TCCGPTSGCSTAPPRATTPTCPTCDYVRAWSSPRCWRSSWCSASIRSRSSSAWSRRWTPSSSTSNVTSTASTSRPAKWAAACLLRAPRTRKRAT
ncbi:uncharacterized protein METZ01_LOCUS166147, partial [marine metagenome]